MKKHLAITLGILFLFFPVYETLKAQAGGSQVFRLSEGFVRIAESGQLADTLTVWGDVSAPGRYIIPRNTTVHELISYARGPMTANRAGQRLDWSKVRLEVTISRYNSENGSETSETYTFRYNEPFPAELRDYPLRNDDIISLEVLRRPSFVDWLGVVTSVLGATATTIIILDRLSD
ncbi:MAG: hypothetical protein JJU13_10400 [Balneolaceae bacterium]|nr:hypothetical protein [Balneolaceae bacterium]